MIEWLRRHARRTERKIRREFVLRGLLPLSVYVSPCAGNGIKPLKRARTGGFVVIVRATQLWRHIPPQVVGSFFDRFLFGEWWVRGGVRCGRKRGAHVLCVIVGE